MNSQDIRTILLDALDDERKAEATYAAVIDKFGPARPFINIIDAERRHSEAIKRQLQRLGFDIPADQWAGKGEAPASLAAACEIAIEAELANIALYDRLIPLISDTTARQVLQNLQNASRENHLPAFRRCLARQGEVKGPRRGSCRH
jgi:rubrerythrin